ncbi:MAG: hypothetical protein IAE81_23210 [Caldilineaceae bacterium]|nr:hypothetical protein [Caldilineaceae bacterium]
MRVVSNTSPILNLAIIDHLYLLHEQMGEVVEEKAGFFVGKELRRQIEGRR